MQTTDPSQLDEPRRRLLALCRDRQVTLAMLSRAAGKNDAYMHQYVNRGTPRVLPEDVRTVVAARLRVPQETLMPGGSLLEPLGEGERVPAAAPAVANRIARDERILDLPAFRQDEPILTDRSETRVPRPWNLVGVRGAYALWIITPTGVLNPGDLAYVHPVQPPRIGDTVVVLQADRVQAVGALATPESLGTSALHIRVRTPQGETGFARDEVTIHKVVGAQFA